MPKVPALTQVDNALHRSLLETAADAAGHTWRWHNPRGGGLIMQICVGPFLDSDWREWNPLWNTSDATELAIQLRMKILHNKPSEEILWVSAVCENSLAHAAEEFTLEVHRVPGYRLAVVRAAAVLFTYGKGSGAQVTAAEVSPDIAQHEAAVALPEIDRSGRWLTVVYADVKLGEEARAIGEHPKVSALSWSHALHDRDAAIAALEKAVRASDGPCLLPKT